MLVSLLCFTCIWATSGYHEWGRGIVSTQCLHCVLHASERHQGIISEPEGLSQLNGCVVFYMNLSDIRVSKARPRHCLNSKFVLCFTYAFERHQGTIGEAEVLSQVNVCICVLHALEQRTISEAEGCINSMFVLRFTRIWATSGDHEWGWSIVSTQGL